ncbi:MAG: hypothetical protein JXR13_20125, partial [Thalassovita sp.]
MSFTTAYHISFIWADARTGGFTDWTTAEHNTAETMGDVIEQIGEYAENDKDRVRVIKFDLSEGTCRDLTEDALTAFGQIHLESNDEWPLWLFDFAPDDI